ncbi:uncharacterized protein LOC132044255 [Lycium ferocissimum]|uniref:uncharacterized protein LOC132044255 n=1 Tax=Lycium ferocissimum TaxID=112874 RepID=UPI00281584E0|nr:uncharacterized protein LOC132044255 [Lycium ferocissimum]
MPPRKKKVSRILGRVSPAELGHDQDLRNAVQLLARLVATQTQRQAGLLDRAVSSRVRDILTLYPPIFMGTNPKEDPQNFVDRIGHALRVMHASDTESVELASYRLWDVTADVFLDELLGLPPEREIESAINVYPVTQPISIPSYRMSPAELQELKVQFQDLLDKGFVRPDTSRGGKDYDAEILLHPGKANVVVDALSRKSMGSLLYVPAKKLKMTRELYRLANLGVCLLDSEDTKITFQNISQSTLASDVKAPQNEDPILVSIKKGVQKNRISAFELDSNGILKYRGRLCVKIEHQKPSGLLQEMEIPVWKWEVINMDFITGLPCCHRKFDSIWVIVDRLTKSAYFLPVRTTHAAEDYAKLYLKEIVRLPGIPVAYELELPSELLAVHPVFHVSMLRTCIGDPSRIVSVDDIQVTENLTYEEEPIAILDRQVRRLRNKDVASVKVLWRSKDRAEMTWEAEA